MKYLVIDPQKMHDGTCYILQFGEGKVAVCKDGHLIKIFQVVAEE